MSKKILLVEDDQAIFEVVKIILENEDYKILVAETEKEIHKIVNTQSPDLILLDIWLSGYDGGKIAKTLKTQKQTKHIPIVIVSANNATEKITKVSGADDFLLKPFNVDDLLRIVHKYCRQPQ